MKRFALILLFTAVCGGWLRAADDYPLGPDSQRQPGVPQGKVEHFTWTSRIFPGTTRDYWVYVPAQYSPDKPACVMVFQDGESFIKEDGRSRVPIVFDNLIARHDMPVTIGIFINPGVLKALSPDQQDRFNRSFEYDGMSDRYSRFLLDEILPEVAKHYKLSANPDDRAIAGLSSGGICAFTVAWNRPDAFHRVLSFIGSFTDLRGGDVYPALIRKTEPKPLRVFLQDGSSDLNIYAGSWWLANQSVASALDWAGYDVKFVTGDKDHDMIQGGAILPDALRWLWRDYPKPIAKAVPKSSSDPRTAILDPASEWTEVPLGPIRIIYKARLRLAGERKFDLSAIGMAQDKDGNVFFSDHLRERITEIEGNLHASTFQQYLMKPDHDRPRGLAFGVNGQLYVCEGDRIVALAPQGAARMVAGKIDCQTLAAHRSGGIYFADSQSGTIWLVDASGRKRQVSVSEIAKPFAIWLSPDQSLLYASDPTGKWIWSFQVLADGALANAEPFTRLETADESSASGAGAITVDSLGYLYVATNLGIQVCDQPGRVVTIIDPPVPGPVLGVAFGGPDLQDLYVDVRDKIYKRHLLRKGVSPAAPVKPPVPRL